jgi:hypothetical protein
MELPSELKAGRLGVRVCRCGSGQVQLEAIPQNDGRKIGRRVVFVDEREE